MPKKRDARPKLDFNALRAYAEHLETEGKADRNRFWPQIDALGRQGLSKMWRQKWKFYNEQGDVTILCISLLRQRYGIEQSKDQSLLSSLTINEQCKQLIMDIGHEAVELNKRSVSPAPPNQPSDTLIRHQNSIVHQRNKKSNFRLPWIQSMDCDNVKAALEARLCRYGANNLQTQHSLLDFLKRKLVAHLTAQGNSEIKFDDKPIEKNHVIFNAFNQVYASSSMTPNVNIIAISRVITKQGLVDSLDVTGSRDITQQLCVFAMAEYLVCKYSKKSSWSGLYDDSHGSSDSQYNSKPGSYGPGWGDVFSERQSEGCQLGAEDVDSQGWGQAGAVTQQSTMLRQLCSSASNNLPENTKRIPLYLGSERPCEGDNQDSPNGVDGHRLFHLRQQQRGIHQGESRQPQKDQHDNEFSMFRNKIF